MSLNLYAAKHLVSMLPVRGNQHGERPQLTIPRGHRRLALQVLQVAHILAGRWWTFVAKLPWQLKGCD